MVAALREGNIGRPAENDAVTIAAPNGVQAT